MILPRNFTLEWLSQREDEEDEEDVSSNLETMYGLHLWKRIEPDLLKKAIEENLKGYDTIFHYIAKKGESYCGIPKDYLTRENFMKPDENGSTPLHLIFEKRLLEEIEQIIEIDQDTLNIKSQDGRTVLISLLRIDRECETLERVDILELLRQSQNIKFLAKEDIKGIDDIIDKFSKEEKHEYDWELIKLGKPVKDVSPELIDREEEGKTGLHHILYHIFQSCSYESIVPFMTIERLKRQDWEGQTPLHALVNGWPTVKPEIYEQIFKLKGIEEVMEIRNDRAETAIDTAILRDNGHMIPTEWITEEVLLSKAHGDCTLEKATTKLEMKELDTLIGLLNPRGCVKYLSTLKMINKDLSDRDEVKSLKPLIAKTERIKEKGKSKKR